MADPLDPRRLAAMLANPLIRETYARVVLGERVIPSNSRERRALAALIDSGLVVEAGEGLAAPSTPFESLLGALPTPERPTGVERFLRDGRIDRYPAGPADREELLRWVVERAVRPDEVLAEKELGERLGEFADDVAVLRRYLVDFGLLIRTRSGSTYSLPPQEAGW
jgi:hypothetical protein